MAEIASVPLLGVTDAAYTSRWRSKRSWDAFSAMLADPERQANYLDNATGTQSALTQALSLLRSKGGQLYMAGPTNREASDGSGGALDGIGTDPIGYVRNLAAEELGPELVVNGDFSNGTTGWTGAGFSTSVAGGVATVTSTTAATFSFTVLVTLEVGKTYRVTASIANSSVPSGVRANATRGAAGSWASIAVGALITSTDFTTVTHVFTATATDAAVVSVATATAIGQQFRVAGVSVREVRAATQSTTAAKPLLRREPILGPELVVNGDFSAGTTGWGFANATGAVASGELTLTATAASFPRATQTISTVAGKSYRVVAHVRSGVNSPVVRCLTSGWSTSTASVNAVTSVTTVREQSGVSAGNTLVVGLQIGTESATVGSTASFDNISVREILGYTDRYFWEFDGVDDSLSATYEVPQAEGWMICAAIAKLAGSTGRAVSMSNTSTACEMFITCPAGGVQAAVITGSATARYGNIKPLPLGETAVVTAWLNGGKLITRINGVQFEAVTHGLTFSGSTTHVRINSTNNGGVVTHPARIQAPVIASGITTLAEVQQIERAVAQAAGVTLP